MVRRNIPKERVAAILAAPQQTVPVRDGILALQSMQDFPGEGEFLVRVLTRNRSPG